MSYLDKVTVGGTTYDVQDSAAVHFTAQTLTDEAKAQARTNIGAASAGDIPTGTVRYDESQTLTDAQKTQARTNIAAAGPDIHALESLHNVVSYGQDANPVDADAQKRTGMIITLNNTFEATTTPAWLKFSNAYAWGSNENTIKAWTGALTLTQNHRYRLSVHYLSGTYTRTTAGAPIIAIACVAGTAVTIPGVVFDGDTDSHVDFDCSGDAYTNGVHLVVGIRRNSTNAVTLTNYTFALVLQDITDTEGVTVSISDTAPTITAKSGWRYNCTASAVTELSFTPSASGICSVRFKSGSTATVLTLPNTVKMPSWWTGPEASRTYEISIEDGVYGVVTSWA